MEDPFQHGMSKVGQPTGLLDKLESYSRIGFTCLVAKGSNWGVSEAEGGWHQHLFPYAGTIETSAAPHTSRHAHSHRFPRGFWYIPHQRLFNDTVIEQEGRSSHWLITDYKNKDWRGINAQFAQLLMIAGVSEGSLQGLGLFNPHKWTGEAGWEWSIQFKPKADSKMLQKDLKSNRVKKLQMKFSVNRHRVMHMWRNHLWSKSTAMGSELPTTSVETDQESQ